MRTPQENPDGYDAGSCIELAGNLEGDLLLIHGMMDDNVHPNNLFQLTRAFEDAGRHYEMFIDPEAGHGVGRSANRRRWTFLTEHLGAAPGDG